MTIPTMLLSTLLCAIHWFEADGTQKSEGKFVWPPEVVETLIKTEQGQNPTLNATYECKEQ